MKIYIGLFLTGLSLSWGPCLTFCAPILVPYIAGTQKGWLGGLKVSIVFSFARIVPYVILSIISAGIGQYLINRFYQTRESLLINFAAGAFIVLLGAAIVVGKSPHLNFCAPLIKKIGSEKGTWQMVALGLLIGFAPCLPLLGVLAYIAFNAHNLAQGALLGLVFGIGTLISPLILIGSLAGGIPQLLEKRPLVYKIFSRACGLILVYLGMGMIFRVL